MKAYNLLPIIALLAGCNAAPDPTPPVETSDIKSGGTSSLQFTSVSEADGGSATPKPLGTMQGQVALDRAGFSPGVIDGKDGETFKLALRGYQAAKGLSVSGLLDRKTSDLLFKGEMLAPTRLVRIPAAFARQTFFPDLPEDAAKQAEMPALGYRNLLEALAERWHTTPETLVALNSPTTKIGASRVIRVPNIRDVADGVPKYTDRGWGNTLQSLSVDADQFQAAKVVVDESDGVLRVFDTAETLIAQFPATMGSKRDPLPLGTWKIQGISYNPEFHYNPKLFWDVSDTKKTQLLPPGPNGPVGVTWIDLSKPHYGIHGTSEPHTIGRAESHGCVRLTNWDVARLSQMIGKLGISAVFQS